MKRSNRIIVLSIVLAVVCVATFILTQYEDKKEEIKNSNEIILQIPKEKVTELSWEFPNDDTKKSLSFHKNEKGWMYDDDEAFPVSEEKINKVLSLFESFGVKFIIENVEDYNQYGFDNPETIIKLKADDKSYEIKLGNMSKMDEQRYIDIGDGNVYLVSEDPNSVLETKLSGMIKNDEVPKMDKIVDIECSGSINNKIIYNDDGKNSYSDDDKYFVEIENKKLPLDTEKVDYYINSLDVLYLEDYATYNATDEELKKYGFDNPELNVSIKYINIDEDKKEVENIFTFDIAKNIEEQKAYDEAKAEGKTDEADLPTVTKYVRVKDSKIVYKITDQSYQTLSKASYNDLRHDEIIWADFDEITQIDVSLENKNHSLIAMNDEKNEDNDKVWKYNDKEIEISAFNTALKALKADSFTDEKASQKEEISLVVHLNDDNFSQIEIKLYRYDGEYCLAEVNGESISLIKRSLVMDLVEAVQSIVLN